MKGIMLCDDERVNHGALLPMTVGALIALIGTARTVYYCAIESEKMILLLSIASLAGGLYSMYLVFGTIHLASKIPDVGTDSETATIRYRKAENEPYYFVESDDFQL